MAPETGSMERNRALERKAADRAFGELEICAEASAWVGGTPDQVLTSRISSAARDVLRTSEDPGQLELARQAMLEVIKRRIRPRVQKTSVLLVGAGAKIVAGHEEAATIELARQAFARELEEIDEARRQRGHPYLDEVSS